MKEFKTVIELTCNLHLIPEVVALDVMKRMIDWLITPGTTETDDYILKQLDYASMFIKEKVYES